MGVPLRMRSVFTLCVLLLVAAPMAIAANDWPQSRYNETHQGSVPADKNSEFTIFTSQWWTNVSIPGPPGSPAVRDNVVYIGDNNGKVWALDQESGGVIWTNTTTASPIVGAPAVGPDNVYFVSKSGTMFAFNRKTGQNLGSSFQLSAGASEVAPTFSEGDDILYVAGGTGVTAFTGFQSGSPYVKWSYAGGNAYGVTCGGTGSIRGSPVVFGSQVMFGSTNGCFYSVNKTSLGTQTNPNWIFKGLESIRSTPAIDIVNSKVVFGDQAGNLYSLPVTASKAVTGAPIYTEVPPAGSSQSAEIAAAPTIAGDKLIIASRDGNVRALPLAGGTATWTTNLNAQVTSSPAVANGHVLVGSFDGNMYMLKLADGTVEKTWRALAEIESSPAISGTQGFWASKDGTLYSYGGTKPARPDIAVTGLSASGVIRGQSTTVSATITNVGSLPAEVTSIKLYANGLVVHEGTIGALEPGASQPYSGSFAASAAGPVSLRLFADATRLVREGNEANNEATTSITIEEPAASSPGAGGPGSSDEEKGVPGFDAAFVALALLGAGVLLRRRR